MELGCQGMGTDQIAPIELLRLGNCTCASSSSQAFAVGVFPPCLPSSRPGYRAWQKENQNNRCCRLFLFAVIDGAHRHNGNCNNCFHVSAKQGRLARLASKPRRAMHEASEPGESERASEIARLAARLASEPRHATVGPLSSTIPGGGRCSPAQDQGLGWSCSSEVRDVCILLHKPNPQRRRCSMTLGTPVRRMSSAGAAAVAMRARGPCHE